jgi:hypothetical protein
MPSFNKNNGHVSVKFIYKRSLIDNISVSSGVMRSDGVESSREKCKFLTRCSASEKPEKFRR